MNQINKVTGLGTVFTVTLLLLFFSTRVFLTNRIDENIRTYFPVFSSLAATLMFSVFIPKSVSIKKAFLSGLFFGFPAGALGIVGVSIIEGYFLRDISNGILDYFISCFLLAGYFLVPVYSTIAFVVANEFTKRFN